MRTRFDKELERLHLELTEMGALCEEAIGCAARSLIDGDKELLPRISEIEKETDRHEREIESLCLDILLREHPVARDLRAVSSALKMISDMERISDQAEDIAEILEFFGENPLGNALHIPDMARATIKMVTDSIEAFVGKDLEGAYTVIDYDDVVDELFYRVKKELTEHIRKNPENAEACFDLLMIAKYFERIGDHATNIAEWVAFSITGVH